MLVGYIDTHRVGLVITLKPIVQPHPEHLCKSQDVTQRPNLRIKIVAPADRSFADSIPFFPRQKNNFKIKTPAQKLLAPEHVAGAPVKKLETALAVMNSRQQPELNPQISQ